MIVSCPRKGYYGLLYKGGFDGGKGPELVIGLCTHAGLEGLFRSDGDIRTAMEWADKEFAEQMKGSTITADWKDHLSLAKALVLGWKRAHWTAFHEQFEVLMIEEETRSVLAPNITLAARADLVVRERPTGRAFVWNWKTMGDKKDFLLKWDTEMQMWTEALAMEDHLGEEVHGCIVEGLYKGGKSTAQAYTGASTSPLVCGYAHEDGSYSWKYSAAKGWKRFSPATSYPGGLEGWINFLPLDVVEDQFIRTHPISMRRGVVGKWIKQIVRRITDSQRMLESDVPEEDREAFFIQNFGYFRCGRCPFKAACLEESTIEEMFDSGALVQRIDHHAEKDKKQS